MSHVDVFALDALSVSIRNLHTAQRETGECCDEGIRKAEQMLQDTQGELQFSETLLTAAQVEEAAKLALQLKADARMAVALSEEASAIASGNPIAIVAASAEVAAAANELAEATEEYQRAREHRERLEHRRDLARKCVDLAQTNLDLLRLRYQYGRTQVDRIVFLGCDRLQAAYMDLETYLARISPQARQSTRNYRNWEPKEKKTIDPVEDQDRLKPDEARSRWLNSELPDDSGGKESELPDDFGDKKNTSMANASPAEKKLTEPVQDGQDLVSRLPCENGSWEGERGNSRWIPDKDYIPPEKSRNPDKPYSNPQKLTMGEIQKKYNIDGIPFRNGFPDFSEVSKGTVQIEDFCTGKGEAKANNFARADIQLAKERNCTPDEVKKWRKENNYTWHECEDKRTMQKVPNEIHANVAHNGGRSQN
jgi:hypothetical protein